MRETLSAHKTTVFRAFRTFTKKKANKIAVSGRPYQINSETSGPENQVVLYPKKRRHLLPFSSRIPNFEGSFFMIIMGVIYLEQKNHTFIGIK